MADVAALISAIASIFWPAFFAILVLVFRKRLGQLLASGAEVAVEFMGGKLSVKPTQRIRPVTSRDERNEDIDLAPVRRGERLPADYVFLNHTSFLREEKQAEFQRRTGVHLPHYDIRVVLDSYYRDALDRVERVEYVLHEAYPEPIKTRTNRKDKFLLKELANGEYVLLANVFLKGQRTPVVLQRYITLWKEGPRIDRGREPVYA